MWKILCLLSLFTKALSAPSGCIEMCNSMNSQSFQKLSCCGLPMVASQNDDKNWTEHNDFKTNDGALVHTKDGRFEHGNTRGSFNEMSYYKEFGSGSNQNFGSNFGANQYSGSNSGVNQRIEDLTSSQSSFESMFQSKFAGLIQNFHDSFNHLQELKRKGQLQTQECVHPCVPVNDQIVQLQQQLRTQQQYMERMREDLWTRSQNRNSMTEHVEQVPVVQQPVQPVQSTYYPGHVVKEVTHHESHRNEKIITHPHISTKVTNQPIKYVSAAQQNQGTGSSNQGYYRGSTSQQGSTRYSQGYGSGVQTQAGYDQQNLGYGSQVYGSQTAGSLTDESIAGISQTQAGRGQQNSGYSSQSYGQTHYGSQNQAGYTQRNPVHGFQAQRQTDGSEYGSQGCGPQGCSPQGTVTLSHGTVSHSSMTQNYGVGFGSSDGSLTHGSIDMGSSPDCNDESHLQSYSQIRRHKRSPYHQHHHHHHQHEGSSQQLSDSQQVEQHPQDYSQQSSQRVEDFGEPARIQKVSQKEIEALGQQVEDIRRGKVETQDIHQQSQDFTQQTQDLTQKTQDLSQQTQDFTQQSQQLGNDYYQQGRNFDDFPQQTGKLELVQQKKDDYSQHSGKIEFGQQHQQYPSQIGSLSQQTEDLTQQHQTHPSQIQSLSQQNEDFSQQQNHGFDQHSGKLEFGQYQQHPSQIESLSQQTQGFGSSSEPLGVQKVGKPSEVADLTQQTQIVSDFSQHPRGFDQQTVGNLKFDQPARDSLVFNQFQTPVLAPDSNQSGNQGQEGLNQQFNLPAKPAPKPTSRPRSQKSTQFNLDKDNNSERIFNTDQENQRPFENLRNTGRGDISAESRDSPTDQVVTSHEFPDTQKGYQQSSGERYGKDFGQHIQKPSVVLPQQEQKANRDFFQEVQGQSRDFSLGVQKPFEDFSQQVQKSHEGFSQQAQKPFEDFSQQVQNSHEGFSQQAQKPFEDFSQQVQQVRKSFEDYSQQVQRRSEDLSQQVQNPFEDFSQQVQRPSESLSQKLQRPSENFSQQVQRPSDEFSQQVQKTSEDFPQQVQKSHEDFSQISDLSRNKDLTQLPQGPRGGLTQSHQAQDQLTDHITSHKSEQTQEISFGNQWHRSHNPADLTNENLQLEKFPSQSQLTQQVQQTQQIENLPQQQKQVQQREQIPEEQEKEFIRFDQQISQKQPGSWQHEMSREVEIIEGKSGKLEFGHGDQRQGIDSLRRTTEASLQPRILEAYGGRGPYDPMHNEDIFNGVRLNPSATLPPYVEGDPWDIREKPITPREMSTEKVIPLDTSWVFPDAIPTALTTSAPKPGWWSRVGNRFSGAVDKAVDKAKEKARDIFG